MISSKSLIGCSLSNFENVRGHEFGLHVPYCHVLSGNSDNGIGKRDITNTPRSFQFESLEDDRGGDTKGGANMNGRERVQLQELCGIREIVSDLDAIRFRLGMHNVKVLTPRVEVNLRLGRIAQIPLKVEVVHDSIPFIIKFEFSMTYPREPLILSLENDASGYDLDPLHKRALEEQLHIFAASHVGNKGYAVDIIEFLFTIHSEKYSPSDCEAELDKKMSTAHSDIRSPDTESAQNSSSSLLYKCRKCRAVLFLSTDIETHSRPSRASPACSSVFLNEPTDWLRSVTAVDVAGRILCPACSSKVGAFNWSGSRCSCRCYSKYPLVYER